MSYIGLQGRLVCDSPYVSTIINFNKSASGYESCVVGQNNLTAYDAMKATVLLKHKLLKEKKIKNVQVAKNEVDLRRLTIKHIHIENVSFGEKTRLIRKSLEIRKSIGQDIANMFTRIRSFNIQLIPPKQHDRFINSDLDFMPVSCKEAGTLGNGVTRQLEGLTVMLTGVEEGGFQPSNIGSSEGNLTAQVSFGQEGTPAVDDIILYIDITFKEGEGRTAEGIHEAHLLADHVVHEIREAIRNTDDIVYKTEVVQDRARCGCPRIVLVKIVSGLGNMYDTAVFPIEPGGIIGARMMREMKNQPVYLTPCECLDGAIHSLL